MALAKKRHIVTTSHRPIKEVHIIGEREVIFLIYNNIIILLYINHNIRSILRIATSLMGRWDNGTTGQKPRPTLEVPKSSPSPPSPPFRPPEGDTIALLVMKPPRGQYGGLLELPSTALEGCSVLLTTFPSFVNTFSHGAACPIWRSEGKAVTLQ